MCDHDRHLDANLPDPAAARDSAFHIVLIDWRIIKGQERMFEQYWASILHIEDRSEMIGEFLSEISPASDYLWISWNLSGEDIPAECTRFINVGIWSNAEAFEQQVGPYFDPAAGKLPFEFELRRRALLTPKAWRTGLGKLPAGDSYGVR